MSLIAKMFIVALLLLTAACNETTNTPRTEKTEVFKTQTDALEKAKQVEQVLQDSAKQQRDDLNKQTQ